VFAYGAQSLDEVHPGKHEKALAAFCMQWFATPAVFDPQLVSVFEAHGLLHHEPWHVPWVHGLQGELGPALQGSPMSPFVAAQIDPDVAVLLMGWHVVPENGVQSAFVEHPGKQMSTLLPLSTQ
jgi:hypothetical protein